MTTENQAPEGEPSALRAAAQQALDALEVRCGTHAEERTTVIPALRAALAAQPAPEGGPAVDERAAFEDFANDDGDLLSLPNMWQRDARGNYAYASMQTAWTAWQARAALAAQPAPVALTERERVLLDGLIERELDHARQCDHIQNRKMAERQKGWDLERVAMLRKLGGIPAPQTKEPKE